MHWQLGGNFGPVLKACEYRWMECSSALARYIWFEVVTDVADSLANELILWRILAVVLIVMTIIYFMYWKKQWIKEINITNETLKNIDFKVQDLELKINILTYKAQYDTWPVSHLLALQNESDSDNNSSAFPKLNAQNAYFKYFLARKNTQNKALMYNEPRSLLSELNLCDLKTKYISSNEKLMQQTSYTEKKMSLTSVEQKKFKSDQLDRELKYNSTLNLSEEPTTEENCKLYRSSSDSSLNDHIRSSYLGSKKITKINVKPGKLLHRKRISPEITEKKLKFSASSTNNSSSLKNTLLSKSLKQNNHSSYPDNKRDTRETLNQVKEKLQCLHSTLRNYTDDFELNTLNNSQSLNEGSDNIKKGNTPQDIKYSYIKNQQGDCNYEEYVRGKKNVHTNRVTKAINPDMIKKDKTSKITRQEIESNNEKLKKKEYRHGANDKFRYKHTGDENILLENKTPTSGYCVKTDKTNWLNHSNAQTKENAADSDTNQQVSLTESAKESDSDDRSLTALIEEALRFKQELLHQIESRKEKDEIIAPNTKNQNESYDFSNWHSDSEFEPNSLGKITEESSASSVADKKSKTDIIITSENCNNQNASKNSSLLSQHSSNRIIKSAPSNKKTNSSDISSKNSEKKIIDEPKPSMPKTEQMNESNLNGNLKVDSNSNPLSDTSSDTSVNRLIDRLIETERKSAKSLTSAKIKDDAVDSLNTFDIPESYFDNPPFENKQHSLPIEFDAERHFGEEIETSLNADNHQESELTKICSNSQNAQDDLFVRDALVTEEIEISGSISNQHFDKNKYLSINDDNITTSRNTDNSKNVKSMSVLQNSEMGTENMIDKKAPGDFYSDSEIISQKNTQNSKKIIFSSGDANSVESTTFSKNTARTKSNLYHLSCTGQSSSNIQTGFKNSEQCATKSSNSTSKQSAKINFEPGNCKQTKAKSNLNLTTTENTSAPPAHRRSKSHVTSSDSPLMNQHRRAESENILMQLDKEVSNKAFSSPCTTQPSRNCSNDVVIQFQMKKNMSSSVSSKSSSKTSVPILFHSKESNVDNNYKHDIQRKISDESVSSKSSTKSCIPILKTRLELVMKDDNDFNPKSLSTGSLKMSGKCFEFEEDRNNVEQNIEQENKNLSKSIEEKGIFKNSEGAYELEYCTNNHDYVTTYINTMIDSNQLDTNTNNEKQTFDELEIELDKRATTSNQMDSGFIRENDPSFFSKQDATFDSLERHNIDVINMISQEDQSLEIQSASSRALSHTDSKETAVLAKPCPQETNTPITNVANIGSEPGSAVGQLKTLEVSEQLSKEEYVTLGQLINDNPDFEHLLNLGLQK